MKLSPTMQEAINKARAGNRKLYRHPGGFWLPRRPEAGRWTKDDWWCDTNTVKALLRRVAAIETGWHNSGGGTFCVQVTIQ